ncbi:MAG: PQQ-binding-like beta-propeller repeat protein, partial [Acidobacteriota bacterium]
MRSRGRSGGGFREAEARLPAAPLAWLLVSALAVASCSDSPSPPGSEPAPPPAPAESAPAESSAPAPPPQTWRFEGGGEVWAPPSLAGGRVFFVDDEGGRLVALEETSGEEAWSFAAGGRLRGAPAVSAEIVAVTAESGDALALDPAGKLLWRRAANAATGAALGGGAVFAVDRGGELVCLEAADGKERWRVEIGPPAGTPEIAGGRVFAATADGFLTAVDVERGAVLWRRSVGAGAASRVAGGSVYAVGGGFLWALRSADGAE